MRDAIRDASHFDQQEHVMHIVVREPEMTFLNRVLTEARIHCNVRIEGPLSE